MKTVRWFCAIALAVFVGQMAFSSVWDYSQSHILLKFRAVKMAATGEDSDAVQVFVDRSNPFHQAQGVHVYMIPIFQHRDAEGYWQEIPQADSTVEEGLNFIVYPDPREDYSLTWEVVCTTEALTTWAEVEAAGCDGV